MYILNGNDSFSIYVLRFIRLYFKMNLALIIIYYVINNIEYFSKRPAGV